MASDKNLQELFHETLKDIYFAEKKNANPESILKASSSAALLAFAFDPRRNVHEALANEGSKRGNQ